MASLDCRTRCGFIDNKNCITPTSIADVQIADGRDREREDSDELDEIPIVRPDGDVELRDAGKGFLIPPCDSCGGILKPNVVFFGDGIPKDRAQRYKP